MIFKQKLRQLQHNAIIHQLHSNLSTISFLFDLIPHRSIAISREILSKS